VEDQKNEEAKTPPQNSKKNKDSKDGDEK